MTYHTKFDSNVNNLVKSHFPLRERAARTFSNRRWVRG